MSKGTVYVAQHPRAFNSLGIDRTARNNVKSHIVQYRQNGGGRDTYIMSNNGGFAIQEGSYPFCGPGENFKRSLRQYAPVERNQSKSITSISPVRYSKANAFATTLNRFKVYKQRGESEEAATVSDFKGAVTKAGDTEEVGSDKKQRSMGHYRTQSL